MRLGSPDPEATRATPDSAGPFSSAPVIMLETIPCSSAFTCTGRHEVARPR